ncbi:hypothetical protein RvY_05364-2 [Ramazzottius varieornatus]|uniref:Uncharacterized protein n=1 Tax=Ramazzottius varieornatus TaxID=947166 RepID=A0A1D1V4K8_RAMVA|nr:hypothetical protein RvY_05364-2 [Ramazzottius varieornatus]
MAKMPPLASLGRSYETTESFLILGWVNHPSIAACVDCRRIERNLYPLQIPRAQFSRNLSCTTVYGEDIKGYTWESTQLLLSGTSGRTSRWKRNWRRISER